MGAESPRYRGGKTASRRGELRRELDTEYPVGLSDSPPPGIPSCDGPLAPARLLGSGLGGQGDGYDIIVRSLLSAISVFAR